MSRSAPLALAVVLALTACAPASPEASGAASAPASTDFGSPSASAAPSAPVGADEPLAQALAFLTLTTRSVTFTDWEGIKAAYGVSDLDGSAPLEERLAFVQSFMDVAGFSALDVPIASLLLELSYRARGSYPMDAMLTLWSFDLLDLDWEAQFEAAEGHVLALRFREGFDLAPVAARFDERGYGSVALGDAVLHSYAATGSEEWLVGATQAFANVAFLADGRTLLLSTQVGAIEAALAADPLTAALRTSPVLLDAVAALERPTAAWLSSDLATLCDPFRLVNLGDQPEVERLLDLAGTLHPYTVMAIGNRGSLEPPGRIVFGYPDANDAAADLAGRKLLAEVGVTLFPPMRPTSQSLFTAGEARTEGTTLILEVGPAAISVPSPLPSGWPEAPPSLPTTLFGAALFSPLLVAACDTSA